MKDILLLLAVLYLSTSCNMTPNEAKPTKPDPSPFDDEKKNFVQEEINWLKKLYECNVSRYNYSDKWRLYCYY